MLRGTAREAVAEFLGTLTLIVFGCGVVAQVVLSRQTAGEYLSINLAWGLGVTMAVYVAGGVSGAHLNPAVTIALAVLRGFSWSKVAPYIIAQVAGAFVGALIVYVGYMEAFTNFDNGIRQVAGPQGTAGIFATYPQAYLSTFPGGFLDQVIGTALLVGVIFGISDARNTPPPAGMAPLDRRLAGGRDRHDVGLQRRLRDQSRARLRPAPVHVRRRLGRRRVPRRQFVVVGPDRRAGRSAASSAASSMMR